MIILDASAARALIHALSQRPRAELAKRLRDLADDLLRIREGKGPTAAELAAAPRLENWRIGLNASGVVLIGVVEGHPILRGPMITTSPVWALDTHAVAWARTLSRWYALGKPAEPTTAKSHSDLH